MDNTIEYVRIENIIPSKFNIHLDNDIDDLTKSIKYHGIIQPLLLRRINDKYEIVLGNRRYKAALKLEMKELPAIIKKLNDKEAMEYIILDNIQKKDLSENERKNLLDNLIDKYKIDKNYIENNLGIQYTKNEESPSNFNEEKIVKEEVSKINLNGTDVVNLKDLNQRNLERVDLKMNNQDMNNMQNNNPTFGGRFFPSLEDEKVNMNVSSLEGMNNQNNFNNNDIYNLNDNINQNIVEPNNDQNINNFDPLNNINIANPTPVINDPIIPSLNVNDNQNNLNNMDNQYNIPQSDNINSFNQVTNDIPNLNEVSMMNNDVQNINNFSPVTNDIPNIDINPTNENIMNNVNVDNSNEINIPNFDNNPTPVDNNVPEVNTQPIQNQFNNEINNGKDITPVINSIKSIVEAISNLGYEITVSESDFGQDYNLSINIKK